MADQRTPPTAEHSTSGDEAWHPYWPVAGLSGCAHEDCGRPRSAEIHRAPDPPPAPHTLAELGFTTGGGSPVWHEHAGIEQHLHTPTRLGHSVNFWPGRRNIPSADEVDHAAAVDIIEWLHYDDRAQLHGHSYAEKAHTHHPMSITVPKSTWLQLRAWALQMANSAAEESRLMTNNVEQRQWHAGAEHMANGLLTWLADHPAGDLGRPPAIPHGKVEPDPELRAAVESLLDQMPVLMGVKRGSFAAAFSALGRVSLLVKGDD